MVAVLSLWLYPQLVKSLPTPPRIAWFFPAMALIGVLVNGILAGRADLEYRRVRMRYTAKGRAELTKELAELTAKEEVMTN
jgi:hypothetical protein